MKKNSVLAFTFEIEEKKYIPFLDVSVKRTTSAFETTVHRKSTSSDDCINYNSIAPDRYKTGVIKTMINRAYKICSTWETFHCELKRLRQLFTNNNFPIDIIEKTISTFLNKKHGEHHESTNTNNEVSLFYRNQMSSQYKQEENNINKIISENIIPNNNKTVKLLIYYKNRKLSQLFIQNNTHKDESNSHVVYRYTCNKAECQPHQYYIGYTTTTLKQRMTTHAQNGSIKEHNISIHNHNIKTSEIIDSISIIHRAQDRKELVIAEALYIKQDEPPLNNQREGDTRILHIF